MGERGRRGREGGGGEREEGERGRRGREGGGGEREESWIRGGAWWCVEEHTAIVTCLLS